jgi:hypothetical protein
MVSGYWLRLAESVEFDTGLNEYRVYLVATLLNRMRTFIVNARLARMNRSHTRGDVSLSDAAGEQRGP